MAYKPPSDSCDLCLVREAYRNPSCRKILGRRSPVRVRTVQTIQRPVLRSTFSPTARPSFFSNFPPTSILSGKNVPKFNTFRRYQFRNIFLELCEDWSSFLTSTSVNALSFLHGHRNPSSINIVSMNYAQMRMLANATKQNLGCFWFCTWWTNTHKLDETLPNERSWINRRKPTLQVLVEEIKKFFMAHSEIDTLATTWKNADFDAFNYELKKKFPEVFDLPKKKGVVWFFNRLISTRGCSLAWRQKLILSGTILESSPFDLISSLSCLQNNFWSNPNHRMYKYEINALIEHSANYDKLVRQSVDISNPNFVNLLKRFAKFLFRIMIKRSDNFLWFQKQILNLPTSTNQNINVLFPRNYNIALEAFQRTRYAVLRSELKKELKGWGEALNGQAKTFIMEPILDRLRVLSLNRELRIITDLPCLSVILTEKLPTLKLFNKDVIPMIDDRGNFKEDCILLQELGQMFRISPKLKALDIMLSSVTREKKLIVLIDFTILRAVIKRNNSKNFVFQF